MIIWFAALIPFIGAGALYWIWNKKVAIWEGLVMFESRKEDDVDVFNTKK